VLALHDPRVDYMLVVFQKDEADSLPGADCDLPVGALEVGTGDDTGLVRAQALVNPTCDRLQPGHPVGVIEWAAGTHFLDIRWSMEIVVLLKRPAKDAMQFERDRRLAAARDPHQHQHHRRNGSLGGAFRRLYAGTVSGWHCRLRPPIASCAGKTGRST